MRIGIEAQRLFRPHKHGMDRVALELIRNLQVLDQENEYFIFVKPDEDNQVITETENFKIIEIQSKSYAIWEQIKLPKAVKEHKCDILHCTSNTAPFGLKTTLITTLHDVIFNETSILKLLSTKASWYQKLGNLYRRLIVNYVVSSSDKLITVSNFENANIKRLYKLDNDKIQTVHNGVNQSFTLINDEERLSQVKQKYMLPESFVLHIGNTDPRKNTARVLQAFSEYISSSKDQVNLVLVGLSSERLQSMLKQRSK